MTLSSAMWPFFYNLGKTNVIEHILYMLDYKSLRNAQCVSKLWNDTVNQGLAWKRLLEHKVKHIVTKNEMQSISPIFVCVIIEKFKWGFETDCWLLTYAKSKRWTNRGMPGEKNVSSPLSWISGKSLYFWFCVLLKCSLLRNFLFLKLEIGKKLEKATNKSERNWTKPVGSCWHSICFWS